MILAIDQGTTGTTCLVFGEDGRPSARAYREFTQHFPRPGWVEHDAAEIWDVSRAVAGEALERRRASRPRTCARSASPTSARPSSPGTGAPASRCTARSSGRTAARRPLRRAARAGATSRWCASAPGLVIDPYFSGHEDRMAAAATSTGSPSGPRPATRCFGTIDAWLAFKLTGSAVDRLLERVADDAVRHPRPALGRRAVRAARRAARRRCRRRARPRTTSGETDPDAFFGARVPAGRHRRATSRRRCSGRPAIARGSARTPTGPAASCC